MVHAISVEQPAGQEVTVELAHGRILAPPPGSVVTRASRTPRREQGFSSHRVILSCVIASVAPLATLLGLVTLNPTARAVTLLWPLLSLSVAAAFLAIIAGRAVTQPQQRSMIYLQRLARRILNGDSPIALPSALLPEFHPLAGELGEIAAEVEMLRSQLSRTTRELDGANQQRQTLVNSLTIANRHLDDRAAVVSDFVQTANRHTDQERMCLELLHALDEQVTYQEALVFLADAETGELRLAGVSDRVRNYRNAGRYLGEVATYAGEYTNPRSLPMVVLQAGRSITVSDFQVDRRFVGLRDELRCYLAVPIEIKSRVIGVLQIGTPEANRYDDEDERKVEVLVRVAALWIEYGRLLQEAAKLEASRKLDHLKSELLSTVSHELRTPLASIKGYASSLLRDDVEWDRETEREFLQIIDEESDRLSALIDDVLQMSEIEAGVLRVKKQPVQIVRLAQKVVKKLRPHAQGHKVQLLPSPTVPETMADPRRIEQILHNLIVNAIKYSPEGTPVSISVESHDDRVQIAVRDQGIGIPSEHLAHVFDRFFRVDGTLTRQTGGSGLGLSICRGLVEAHGGKIWVESQVGAGSVFYFDLPIIPVPPAADLDDETLELGEFAASD